jgi:hypothetical protein
MGIPLELPPTVRVGSAGESTFPPRPFAEAETRLCLHCGHESRGEAAVELPFCPVCRCEFSVWGEPAVRPLPRWLMRMWAVLPGLAAPALWLLPAETRAEWSLPWSAWGAAAVILYAWAARRLREERVPARAFLAVPLAGAMLAVNAVLAVPAYGLMRMAEEGLLPTWLALMTPGFLVAGAMIRAWRRAFC